jgi:hypothetical protein
MYLDLISRKADTEWLQIFTGFVPFSHIQNDARVVLVVVAGGRPRRERCPQIGDGIWAMLETCWDVEPSQRPSMGTLCQFFASQLSWMALE